MCIRDRCWIATVIETITCPRCARHFHPFEMVRLRLLRSHVHHVILLPVRPTFRNTIHRHLAVFRRREDAQTRRAIGGELVRIEKNLRRTFQSLLDLEPVSYTHLTLPTSDLV